MIAVNGLALSAGGKPLLADVSFAIGAGEFVGILGRNGAGKTTLLRALAGLHAADRGSILLNERNVAALSPAERSRDIAFVTSDDVFADRLTVRDVVAAGRYPHHRWWQWNEEPADAAAIGRALADAELEELREREFTTLSSGERQRVWIALALAQETPVLFLDEPTSHLDVRAAQQILRLLRAQVRGGKTVVCVLHDPNEAAAHADRVMLLAHGGILAFDAVGRALSPELLGSTYGVAMEAVAAGSGATRIFPLPG
jgi:iron complex transport system ATP-binding protein